MRLPAPTPQGRTEQIEEGYPGRGEGRRGWKYFKINHRWYRERLERSTKRRFKVITNLQGWLPPAALSGCGGRAGGRLYIYLLISYILTSAGS